MSLLRAEWIRAKGSTLWWLAVAGLLLGLLLTAFSLVGDVGSAKSLLYPQGLLVTGMAAPVAALFAGLAENRERDARAGGALWRPVSSTGTRAARITVVWLALAVFVILDFVVPVAAALVFGLDGAAQVALVGAFVWLGMLGPAGLAAAATRRVGLLPTLVAAFVFTIELGYFVERSWWWCNPGAWPARLALPTMGLHFNLLPLEETSPMAGESPFPALALTLLLAAAGFVAAVLTPRRTRPIFRRLTTHEVAAPAPAGPAIPRPARTGFVSAWKGVARAGRMPSLSMVLVLTALVLLLATRYPADVRQALFAYAILPVGAGVLPTLVWPRIRPAWALMQVEHPRVGVALMSWFTSIVALVCLLAGAVAGSARFGVLAVIAGTVLTLAALAVTVRFGVMWTLAATILVTIVSATIGGDVLAESFLWIAAVPAWPVTATGPRVWVALAVGAILLAAVVVVLLRVLRGMRPVRR